MEGVNRLESTRRKDTLSPRHISFLTKQICTPYRVHTCNDLAVQHILEEGIHSDEFAARVGHQNNFRVLTVVAAYSVQPDAANARISIMSYAVCLELEDPLHTNGIPSKELYT